MNPPFSDTVRLYENWNESVGLLMIKLRLMDSVPERSVSTFYIRSVQTII